MTAPARLSARALVDLSSGYEAAKKDPSKLNSFLETVRQSKGNEELFANVQAQITKRDTAKKQLRERQNTRMASMLGRIAPRSQTQTATLLSSAQPATATLLG